MQMTSDLSNGILVYIAFSFGIAGYLARDELWLRSLMLVSSGFYIAYYATIGASPLWDPIVTNSLLAAANLAVLGVVVTERSRLFMTSEMGELYTRFPRMTPGQFRKMMRAGRLGTASSPMILVSEGQSLDRLYFVLDGDVTIEKQGKRVRVAGPLFIGEVAFLTKRLASATVHISEGGRYIEWSFRDIEKLSERSPALGNALLAHLNLDMAAKVANSQPLEP